MTFSDVADELSSPFPAAPDATEKSREHLAYSDLQRLFPLPHQSFKSTFLLEESTPVVSQTPLELT